MHGHRHLLTDVVKGKLGFSGFVVSDWAGIDQLPGDYTSDVETAVNAGIDMVMLPDRYPEFVTTLKGLVQSGRVPQSRVDDAVRRLLRKKVELGLFEKPMADRALLPQVGSDAHRQVGREAVRKSLVLLKNERRALPLSKMARRILGPILGDADAVLAAWLPRTEGAGVADVLFGDFAPTGKLSHSWPRTMAQVPLNWGDTAYDPLYPYGYGLSY